jgi:tetratricopeptide (TPR) repeat protein
MAGVLLQQQLNDEAAEHYTRALELNEHNACWLVDLGHIHRVQNRREDAKMCFIKAASVNPRFAIAFSNLACIFKDEGKQLATPLAFTLNFVQVPVMHSRLPLESALTTSLKHLFIYFLLAIFPLNICEVSAKGSRAAFHCSLLLNHLIAAFDHDHSQETCLNQSRTTDMQSSSILYLWMRMPILVMCIRTVASCSWPGIRTPQLST